MPNRRFPASFAPNELTQLLERKRREGAFVLDLTETNPTHVGLGGAAPDELRHLADPANASYDPDPRGDIMHSQISSPALATGNGPAPEQRRRRRRRRRHTRPATTARAPPNWPSSDLRRYATLKAGYRPGSTISGAKQKIFRHALLRTSASSLGTFDRVYSFLRG